MKSGISETQPRVCRDGAELQQWSCAPKKLSVIYLTCGDPSGASAMQSQQEGLTSYSLLFSFVVSVLET